MRWAVTILLGASVLGGPACHKPMSAMRERAGAVAANRDVDKLRALIRLPAQPAEVWFDQVPRAAAGGLGPAGDRLVAVLRFDHADLAPVTAAAQHRPGTPPRISATANRAWFPEAVTGAIRPYDEHSIAVRGDKFDAAPFAKPPFLSGDFVAVEGGEYVIVVMETR